MIKVTTTIVNRRAVVWQSSLPRGDYGLHLLKPDTNTAAVRMPLPVAEV